MQIPSGKFYKTKSEMRDVDIDVELRQMPKRSIKFDISRSMIGGKPAKRAKMDKRATDTERAKTDTKATHQISAKTDRPKKAKTATDTEINIKPAGETPEDFKKAVVAQLIKEGKVRMTRSLDFSKK